MPIFDDDATERIRNVVRRIEADYADNTPADSQNFGDQPLQWVKLTSDINSTTHLASGNPGRWTAAGNGFLAPDTNTTRIIRDTTNASTATNSNWVLCRPIGSDNGTVWEMLLTGAGSPGLGIGVLTSPLSQGSSANFAPWTCSNGSFSAIGGSDQKVYDWLLKVGAAALNSNSRFVYLTIGDTKVLTEAECP